MDRFRLPPPLRVNLDTYPTGDRYTVPIHKWVHGGNRPHPIQFGNILLDRWTLLALTFMRWGLPAIELDTAFNQGKIHSNTHWPDNEIMIPKALHWLARDVIVDSLDERLRGHLPGIALPLPLCPDIMGDVEEELPALCQVQRIITAVNNTKLAQHPQRLNEVVDLTIYDRMWWLREIYRVIGRTGLQFDRSQA